MLERVTARLPTDEESQLLDMSQHRPVLNVYAAAHEPNGQPLLLFDVVFPADRHELEDAYPLT